MIAKNKRNRNLKETNAASPFAAVLKIRCNVSLPAEIDCLPLVTLQLMSTNCTLKKMDTVHCNVW
jgi:hypothetical protein